MSVPPYPKALVYKLDGRGERWPYLPSGTVVSVKNANVVRVAWKGGLVTEEFVSQLEVDVDETLGQGLRVWTEKWL